MNPKAISLSPIAKLTSLIEAQGGTVRLSLFDGGETVRIDRPHRAQVAFTSEWGDRKSAVEMAFDWLDTEEADR